MISLGTRDARKELGLGFGVGGNKEMDDTELEEGEAYSYHHNKNNNGDEDASIDPDIALSYIDEKLQDVLGHFQKDFEGGVSAENLGAKFGGYGSFLPTYQRSPAWSQRTPPKVQSYSASRSPNNFHQEGGHCNSVVSSTAPQSGGRGPASTSSSSLLVVKRSSVNDLGKHDINMAENRVEEVVPRLDSKNKKHLNASDRKTLKVRIKVGSDNLSMRKNAAIYSGLGLDDSPSSSMDDSPSESEGISHESQDAPFESPASILQIMTSFPVHGGLLLSPLHDDLINLMEKEKLLKETRCVPFPRAVMETSSLINGSDTMRGDEKTLGEKNMKSVEKSDHSAESKSGNDKDARTWDSSRKETVLDALSCEELVSNTLKLPILSNSYSTTIELKKGREFNKSVVKENVLSDRGEDHLEDGWVDKRKASTAGKVWVEGKESNTVNETAVHSSKEDHLKGERVHGIVKSDSNVSKGKKVLNGEGMDSSKQKSNKKVASYEQENARLHQGKEYPVPGGKKKSKGSSHNAVAGEVQKESSKVSSLLTKTKKNTMENCLPTSEAENGKLYKDPGKTAETYKDFFGEMEEGDNAMDLLEAPVDKPKEFDNTFAKSRSVVNSVVPRERPSAKKIEKASTSEAAPLLTATSPRLGNGLNPNVAQQPAAAPVLIEENWVCCDKCQKWRLLPLGTNPDHLPEKWLCSMLNWLPGMNRCSFTEEETNNALIALYQAPVPVPESQTNLHSNPGAMLTGTPFASFRHPDQNPRNSSGKKKNGLKVVSNSLKDSSIQSSKSMKNNIQASSAKSRSLSDVNDSPLVNEPDLQLLSRSNDLILENQTQKYKEKSKGSELNASAGDSKSIKMKSRRDSDVESSRASKKIKTEAKTVADEGWASDHSGAIGKMGPSSSGGFATSSAGKDRDRDKYSDRSFRTDSKSDVKDRFQVSISKRKVKNEVSLNNGSVDIANMETRDSLKRPKTKEVQNGSYQSTVGNLPNGMPLVKEEFSDNDYRKEKKQKVSRSEAKESSASRGHGRTDKKRSHSKSQQSTQDIGTTQPNLDGLDSSKRDLGSRQASAAATSSSSKVSGSHKTKSSFQEVKGSPVESVSSSPMRISNPDRFMSVGRDGMMKDDFQNNGAFATRSPKRSCDGDGLGGNNHDRVGRADNASNVAHRGSLDFPAQDFPHVSSSKAKIHNFPSPDATNHHPTNSSVDVSGQDAQHSGRPLASDRFSNEEKQIEGNDTNGSHPRKSVKGSLSRSDKCRNSKSDFDAAVVKSSDVGEPLDRLHPGEVKVRDGKKKQQEKLVVNKSDEIEEKVSSRKDVSGKQSSDMCKRGTLVNGKGPDGDAIFQKDAITTPKHNLLPETNDERSSKRLVSDKTDQLVEAVSSGERSMLLPPSGVPQTGTLNRSHPSGVSRKGNGADASQVYVSDGDNGKKVEKQIRKADNQRSQQTGSRHPTKNGHRAREIEVPSPARRDVPNNSASNALKEAKDLKHMADRLKSAGSSYEGTGLYFQAALKFLHGASLLEAGCGESSNHNEMVRSRQTYSETAKLCEFCAHEYEKSKDMAAAALAYKCTEVAYMRVIYSLHGSANRDRHDLQEALKVVPPGESPSSSASDIDNLNNHTTVDKVALSKGVSSPQVASSHVIAARNRPNFVRLLGFAQDVNYAMEAIRKSWAAFGAAYGGNKAEAKPDEAVCSVKRVLNFSFHDIDGLLPLVRVAMEAIGSVGR